MRRIPWRRPLASAIGVSLLLAGAFTGTAWAQTDAGSLYGRVADDDGGRLPGVTVTLSGQGADKIQITDEVGEFRFLGLDPGNYQIEAALDGFGSVIFEAVNIRIGRNTTIEMQLNPAIEETITVTTESPLLDERKISKGISVTALELQKIPSARDPWSVAGQTPGVLMDRINVGGNESGQQPNFIGSGSAGAQNKFTIDGVDITDQSATGASSTYFGFEQFEEMSFSTGGTDVEIETPGVQLNMVTKRGTNEWRGSGSFNLTDEEYQASNNLNTGDLPGQQLVDEADDLEGLTGNKIDEIQQWGAEAGGFVWKDRVWVWGSVDENDINQSVFGGGIDNTLLENWAVKLNAQITDANSFVYTKNEGEKVKTGRGSGPTRPAPTTWNQGGPSPLQKVEDTHVFNSSFFLTGSWSEMKGGFFLEPQGGRDIQAWRDGDLVWNGSYYWLDNQRPSERYKLDGSYFFATGDTSHELKFGYSYRTASETSNFNAPANGLITRAAGGEFGPGASVVARAWRETATDKEGEYNSVWVQDTFTSDRLTVNLGARFDQQSGVNNASAAPASGFAPDLLPALDFQGNDPGFEFEDISPRLGATYALGEQRRTLVRASYSRFADQLGLSLITEVNPVGTSIAFFTGTDTNGDGILQLDEPFDFDSPVGFDPSNPSALNSPNQIDPNLDAVITDEFIFGVEHAFLPELVGSLTVTWREASDYYHEIPLFRDANGNVRPVERSDYFLERTLTGTLPNGQAYSAPIYSVDEALTDTGGVFITNTDRSHEYLGITASGTKRLSNKWMLRAHFTYYDWEWSLGESFRRFDDPTDAHNDNTNAHEWDVDNDGAIFAEESGGSGNVDLFLNSRWSFNISGLYQMPWGVNVSANINGREGYPLPFYLEEVTRLNGGTVDVQVIEVGAERVDDIFTFDLRLDKDFQIGDLGLTVSADVFNLFNEGYVVQREFEVSGGRAGYVDQIIGPRVARFGVRLAWK
ncbi:MAG: carboxypeptidase regulatory-like domain-containing protein [Acidobacteriota bacterium]